MRERSNPLPREIAAYVAGIIDGEGTITLTRIHANESRRLVVSIANCELPLLRYVQQQVGAGKITNKRVARPHHSPSYHYSVSSRQALDLLAQIRPFLRTYQRDRATLALERYLAVTPRNGKYTPELRHARILFERQFLETRASHDVSSVPAARG